ncbi:hypothetical protein J9317_16875 [Metabacillus sp. KIGAM252]|uniref:Uncharacterized protein n=1 Tax=Metabacillus flavus TaxID=2823519 RepID=A0ABS5LI75_9BACI|nr:hypothetical protein [Metabacillus flavus]MBS2970423.1 hypothetical protein [Metabacillus flavus]
MKKTAGAIIISLFAAFPAGGNASASELDLASKWAPVHYQDTDSTDYDADYLTSANYDGDWNMRNNWENQTQDPGRLKGSAYYSVSETETHWFIIYSFYHPRDWTDYPDFGLDTHENDLEGAMMIVRKNGSPSGTLEGMVTVSHNHFYSFVPAGSPLTNGEENIDGSILMTDGRPSTFQESKGHGLKAWNGKEFPGGDGVIYRPGTEGSVPSSGNDRNASYKLIPVTEPGGLWERRSSSETYASFGTFAGDNGKDNAANAPWGWDDSDDSQSRGAMAQDPAALTDAYFDGLGSFSKKYVVNPFR